MVSVCKSHRLSTVLFGQNPYNPCMVYLHLVDFDGKCRFKQNIHGFYGKWCKMSSIINNTTWLIQLQSLWDFSCGIWLESNMNLLHLEPMLLKWIKSLNTDNKSLVSFIQLVSAEYQPSAVYRYKINYFFWNCAGVLLTSSMNDCELEVASCFFVQNYSCCWVVHSLEPTEKSKTSIKVFAGYSILSHEIFVGFGYINICTP